MGSNSKLITQPATKPANSVKSTKPATEPVYQRIVNPVVKLITKKSSSLIKPTHIYSEAERRYQELLKILREKEIAISNTPHGKIHIVCAKGRTQFYLREDNRDKSGKYIVKSETSTIGTFLQKAYDEKVFKLISAEIKGLEKLKENTRGITKKIQDLYSHYSNEVKMYITPVDISDDDYKEAWLGIPFIGKEISDYIPLYETSHKERVRSKSELNIANALAFKGIPYKYECPLQLQNGLVIYPDFTVLNVRERKEIYWEHRGMMDDRDYARQAVLKMKSMAKNGLFMGRDIIITEETSTNPLGTNEIDAIIDTYFC